MRATVLALYIYIRNSLQQRKLNKQTSSSKLRLQIYKLVNNSTTAAKIKALYLQGIVVVTLTSNLGCW